MRSSSRRCPISPMTRPPLRSRSRSPGIGARWSRRSRTSLRPRIGSVSKARCATLVASTGAGGAELYAGNDDHFEVVAHVGPDDALLKGLVELALRAQRAAGGEPSHRTPGRQGVGRVAVPHHAASRRAGSGRHRSRRGLDHLGAHGGGAAHPPGTSATARKPDPRSRCCRSASNGWLSPEEFRGRLELAVERNRRDGLRFTVHRLSFPSSDTAVDRLCEQLPDQLRDTDCICRRRPGRSAAADGRDSREPSRTCGAACSRCGRSAGGTPTALRRPRRSRRSGSR